MKRGPKPKPFMLKLAEGNRGKRVPKPCVEPAAGPFEPAFPLEGVALAEWNRIMAEATWLRATDAVALTDRCLCMQRVLEAEEDIRMRGTLVDTRDGKVMNPALRVARQYRASLQRYDAELGLTSSSRERIGSDTQGKLFDRPTAGPKKVDSIESKLCG